MSAQQSPNDFYHYFKPTDYRCIRFDGRNNVAKEPAFQHCQGNEGGTFFNIQVSKENVSQPSRLPSVLATSPNTLAYFMETSEVFKTSSLDSLNLWRLVGCGKLPVCIHLVCCLTQIFRAVCYRCVSIIVGTYSNGLTPRYS